MRDYSKNSIGLALKCKDSYVKEHKKCECGKEIPYNKRRNEFCSRSCARSNSNKKRIVYYSKDKLEKLKDIAYKNFNFEKNHVEKSIEKYNLNPITCLRCHKNISYDVYIKKRNRKFCSSECSYGYKKEQHLKVSKELKIYKSLARFKFQLNKYDEFDFNLIKDYGWYKAKNHGDNRGGVSRDHIFSVAEGFRNMINPLLLSHPSNCQLMLQKDNEIKKEKCDISLDDLLKNIDIHDEKYGKYYNFNVKIYITLDELNKIYIGTMV